MSLLKKLDLPALPAAAGQPRPAAPAPAAVPKGGGSDKLLQAADTWLKTIQQANARVATLKQAVQAQCADGPPALSQQLDKGLARLDQVLAKVDRRLADALTKAAKADERARAAELKAAKDLVSQYLNAVKNEPLVAHIDRNPFNVTTDLKALLADGLTTAAKAVG
jgi:hypothetical protein